MRFRAKFGALGWCWVSLALFVLILWFGGLHSEVVGDLVFGTVVLALQQVLSHVFIYWEMGSEGLRERRLWNVREIPWREVVHVGGWPRASSSTGNLEIEYTRTAPMSDRGSIIANPEDRSGFLAALRNFAPLAEFADETSEKLIPV